MARPKITVVGAGHVGATLAQLVLSLQLGDVVLLDIAGDMARGKALDLNQAAPVLGYTGWVLGTSDYAQTAGSDVVVVTSGSPRKPGMSRDDLLRINFDIVTSVVRQAALVSPNAVLIIVTNPLDAMTYAAMKVSGFAAQRVMGMAGILDSARFRMFLAEAAHVSPLAVEAMVLGGHGDEMVPCAEFARIAGTPVGEYLAEEKLQSIIQRTRQGGGEIVKLLQTGSAYYAPAASAARMVAAVLRDEHAVLPCAAWLQGEYGQRQVMLGVPVVLGRQGIERVVELSLEDKDRAALSASAAAVQSLCTRIDTWLEG